MLPWNDIVRGLERILDRGPRGLLVAGAGLVAGWWLYVPMHELLHAAACWASGGEVTRLEIAPEYGGRILAGWFSWVVSGSEYAGRLSGFDTRGSDWRYLATDLGPFVLTLFPGVWALRQAARRRLALAWGASLPFAMAPFLSLTGDAYEIASIVTTRLLLFAPTAAARELLRGDDLAKVAARIPVQLMPGFAMAVFLGLAWCFGWYWIAHRAAGALGAGPLLDEANKERSAA
jgi:hypothetical protein